MTSVWAIAAMDNELRHLSEMQPHKIGKPASSFYTHLLKIASVAKGDGMTHGQTLPIVKASCMNHLWLRDRDIEYQFKRAWSTAQPRSARPKAAAVPVLPSLHETPNLLESKAEQQAPRYVVKEYDLQAGSFRVLRHIDGETAVKAHKLITAIKNLISTGELPEGGKFGLSGAAGEFWSKPAWIITLEFSRPTNALTELIQFVALYFRGELQCQSGSAYQIAIPASTKPAA
jgi:hypothetical protein